MAGVDERDVAYISGSEHDPGDSRGEDWLTVRPDDTFGLENRFRGALRTWRGTLAAGSHAELVGLLEAAGFPEVPRHPVPGGSAMREVHHGGKAALVAWHAAGDLPGYAELFAVLDGIVRTAADARVEGRVAEVSEIPGDTPIG